MGAYFYFHVETKRSGRWCIPSDFQGEDSSSPRSFTWIAGRSNIQSLFFGKHATFPFRHTLPCDRTSSDFFQYLDSFYNYELDEYKVSWLPYEELLVDYWDEAALIVTGQVTAKHATLFGDGSPSFPHQELLKAGWGKYEIDELREGSVTNTSVNWSYGKGYYELRKLSPDETVNVTWTEIISSYLKEWHVQAFRELRKYGSDAELRVISTYS